METNTEAKSFSMPRIGDKAPAFKAVTTRGVGLFCSAIRPTSHLCARWSS